MDQLRHRLCFPDEASRRIVVVHRGSAVKQLERDLPVQARVVRSHDDAHAARSDAFDYDVTPDSGALVGNADLVVAPRGGRLDTRRLVATSHRRTR